jgi:hypothetical protein
MPDRVIRDELWQSTRWLDLPTDTHRLVYNSLLHIADDFGNLEGGSRRLFRWMHGFSQVRTEVDSIKLMSDLQDADLVRRYEFENRELWHIPRFRHHRQYLTRKYPISPWDADLQLGKNRRVSERGLAKDQTLAKNLATTLQQHGSDVAEGVGVGVGEVHTAPDLNHLTVPEPESASRTAPKKLKAIIEKIEAKHPRKSKRD